MIFTSNDRDVVVVVVVDFFFSFFQHFHQMIVFLNAKTTYTSFELSSSNRPPEWKYTGDMVCVEWRRKVWQIKYIYTHRTIRCSCKDCCIFSYTCWWCAAVHSSISLKLMGHLLLSTCEQTYTSLIKRNQHTNSI